MTVIVMVDYHLTRSDKFSVYWLVQSVSEHTAEDNQIKREGDFAV